MESPGASLPGWSLGYTQEGGYPYAKLETESGRYCRLLVRFQPSTEPFAGQSWGVATCPASEVVGQCMLFDTKGG